MALLVRMPVCACQNGLRIRPSRAHISWDDPQRFRTRPKRVPRPDAQETGRRWPSGPVGRRSLARVSGIPYGNGARPGARHAIPGVFGARSSSRGQRRLRHCSGHNRHKGSRNKDAKASFGVFPSHLTAITPQRRYSRATNTSPQIKPDRMEGRIHDILGKQADGLVVYCARAESAEVLSATGGSEEMLARSCEPLSFSLSAK